MSPFLIGIIVFAVLSIGIIAYIVYQSQNWKCIAGVNVPIRLNIQGDIECMSLDNKNCLWKDSNTTCNALITTPPTDIKPLVCGEMHKLMWKATGYDIPTHWCTKGMLEFNPNSDKIKK